jgi:hypothetical protein
MEHLKGRQMKRDIKLRLLNAQADNKTESSDSDSEVYSPDRNNGDSDATGQRRPSLHANLFSQFNNPFKFWKHQLSFKENEIKYLDKPLYEEEEASEIMKGFLNGLYHIHKLNYIHRDIKPENIQLAPNEMN